MIYVTCFCIVNELTDSSKDKKAMEYMKQRYEEGGREELQTSARALRNPNKLQRPWGKYACTLCLPPTLAGLP